LVEIKQMVVEIRVPEEMVLLVMVAHPVVSVLTQAAEVFVVEVAAQLLVEMVLMVQWVLDLLPV
ncbi:MAG: hypothetical protein RMM53_14050, partial [Bacteroidia bacterium]|nr:hypothetical protein [Bacteroidia bacterium]